MATSSGEAAPASETTTRQAADYANRARRVEVSFRVDYSTEKLADPGAPKTPGLATISNISRSGALLENVNTPLPESTETVLRFSFFEDSVPVEFRAKVTRITATGFAVSFQHMDKRLEQLLNLAISRVHGRDEALPDPRHLLDSMRPHNKIG